MALSRFASRLLIVSAVGLGLSFSQSLVAQQVSPSPQPQLPPATSPSGQGSASAQVQRYPDLYAAEKKAAEHEAFEFLKCLDEGRYGDGYSYYPTLIRSKLDKDKFVAEVQNARAPLGALDARSLIAASYTLTLPGAPQGRYVVLQYQSDFAKAAGIETIMLSHENQSWRIVGWGLQLQ